MRKLTLIALVAPLLVTFPATTATKMKSTTKKTTARGPALKSPSAKCPAKLSDCPAEGCSTDHEFDSNLNRRKNLTPDDAETKGAAEPMTLPVSYTHLTLPTICSV